MRYWVDGVLLDELDARELNIARKRTGFGAQVELNFISTLAGIGLALGAGQIASGVLGSHAASAQANAAEQASAAAIAEQKRQFDIMQQNMAPWLTAGTNAIQQLQFLLGLGIPASQATQIVQSAAPATGQTTFGKLWDIQNPRTEDTTPASFLEAPQAATGGNFQPSGDYGSLMRDFTAADFQTDPGYLFRLSEGMKARERSAAARGTVLSGGTQRELARYNQDFASNEFTNAYNRFQTNRATRFNQLAAISGLGQTTAGTLANAGQNYASNVGDLIVGGQTAAAAARASGYQNWGNAISGLGNNLMNWYLLNNISGNRG